MAQDETSLLVKADVSSHVASKQNTTKRPHAENSATTCCSADLFCNANIVILGKIMECWGACKGSDC